MDPVYVLKKPLLTEKSTMAQEHANVYLFEVDRRATAPRRSWSPWRWRKTT